MVYCVYKHTCPNGKVYIGLTMQKPETRWGVTGNKYRENKHFYNAIQKYGWENIVHEIIKDELSKDEAGELEKELIARYNAMNPDFGYNLVDGGVKQRSGYKHTEEAKKKISLAGKGRIKKGSEKEAWDKLHRDKRKAVIAYDIYGNFICRCESVAEAAKLVNTYTTCISQVCKRRTKQIKNYVFRYEDDSQDMDFNYERRKPVEQYTLAGELIAKYDSITEAAKSLGVGKTAISKCCKGTLKTAHKYIWKYSTQFERKVG